MINKIISTSSASLYSIDNDSDLAVASPRKIGLANACPAAIDEAAEILGP